MHPLFEKANALTTEVIEAAVEVQKHYGIGLLENIYKLSLAQEMRVRGHKAVTEKEVPIVYKGYKFDENLRLDCLIDDCLLIECKSLDENKIDMVRCKAQTLSYMKLMNIPLGLVINFGDYRLGKRGIARVILAGADDPASVDATLEKTDRGVSNGEDLDRFDTLSVDATLEKTDRGVAREAGVVATSVFSKSAYRDSDLRSNSKK